MSKQPISLHAPTHLPGGSDPIVGSGIEFDTDNVGDWLDVTATGTDPEFWGINLKATVSGIQLSATGSGIEIQSSDLTGSGNSFIDFDLYGDNNAGILFNVHGANNSGWGAIVRDANNGGASLEVLGTNNGGISIFVGGTADSSPGIAIGTADASGTNIGTNGDKVGFFTVGPVAQQATPTTIAGIIALLQAYGLSA